MERLDTRGVEYEMKRDLSIDIMQYILNEFDCSFINNTPSCSKVLFNSVLSAH